MSDQQTIHEQMTISDILAMFPDKAQHLSQEITNAGLHCVGCNASKYETLEAGMMGHGKSRDEVKSLVEKLNALLSRKMDRTTITLTPSAAQKFMEFAAAEGKQGFALRFDEELAGCSGFEYVLDFSEKAEADDQVFTSQGIEIHVKKKKVNKLLGATIDYMNGIRDSGFKIINPNVASSCGCGSSHGYD